MSAPAYVSFPTAAHNTYLPTYATLGSVMSDPRDKGCALNKDNQAFTFFKLVDTHDEWRFPDWNDHFVDVLDPRAGIFQSCHWTACRVPRTHLWVVLAYPAFVFGSLDPRGCMRRFMDLVYGEVLPWDVFDKKISKA